MEFYGAKSYLSIREQIDLGLPSPMLTQDLGKLPVAELIKNVNGSKERQKTLDNFYSQYGQHAKKTGKLVPGTTNPNPESVESQILNLNRKESQLE